LSGLIDALIVFARGFRDWFFGVEVYAVAKRNSLLTRFRKFFGLSWCEVNFLLESVCLLKNYYAVALIELPDALRVF
jgi:hypothetical protein